MCVQTATRSAKVNGRKLRRVALSMESINNFRELGNLPVANGVIRPGLLFRSGHLAAMSDNDAQQLTESGLRTIVDLRNDSDIDSEGLDRVPKGVAHYRVPIYDDAGRGDDLRATIIRGDMNALRAEMGEGRGHQLALDGSVGLVVNAERRATFAAAMTIITDPHNWPLLWHCSAGKDRAGWIGTAVLLAADASPETIVNHYLESNGRVGSAERFPDGELKELIRPFIEVHREYVLAQLAAVEDHWGSTEALFLDGFGIGADALLRFRTALVSSPPAFD